MYGVYGVQSGSGSNSIDFVGIILGSIYKLFSGIKPAMPASSILIIIIGRFPSGASWYPQVQ